MSVTCPAQAHASTVHSIPAKPRRRDTCFTGVEMGSQADDRLAVFVLDSIAFWSIILGKLLPVSEPQFPHLKSGPKNNNVPRIKRGHADNVPGDRGY